MVGIKSRLSFFRRIPRARVYFQPFPTIPRILRPSNWNRRYGPVCKAFEKEFGKVLGESHTCIFPHARVALHCILKCLDLPPGGEVLMTPVTIPDIVNAVLMAGLKPVFVDMGVRTGNIDCDNLQRNIGADSKVILLTHLCGIPSDMDRINDIAKNHNLVVLEDCSQIMGGTWRGKKLGTFGLAGFFSLSTLKPLSTFIGGMVVTSDNSLHKSLHLMAEKLPPPNWSVLIHMLLRESVIYAVTHPTIYTFLTHHVVGLLESAFPRWIHEFQHGNLIVWRKRKETEIRPGHISPDKFHGYSDFQAVVGLIAMETLFEGNRRRRELSAHLTSLLENAGVPGLPRISDPEGCTYWRFPFWVENVTVFRKFLRRHHIDTSQTNLPCLSDSPLFQDFSVEKTPEALKYTDKMVFLPMHPDLSFSDMQYIASTVIKYFTEGGA